MEASDIWGWLESLSILFGVGIKLIAAAFLVALGTELAKKVANRLGSDPEDPP